MGRNTHTQLMECQAELAREREATEAQERRTRHWMQTHGKLLGTARELEGRVRKLEEALERISDWTEAAHTTAEVRDFAREALAGLPE